MRPPSDETTLLTLFSHVAGRPEAELPLPLAALLVAQIESPELDVDYYLDVLEDITSTTSKVVDDADPKDPRARLGRALYHVYQELGFQGNTEAYYDVRNSFLNEVLDRRRGIPITLSVVLIEALAACGFDASGVSFPGHFLVRVEQPRGAWIIDPFEGRVLSLDDLKAMYKRLGGEGTLDPKSLERATKKQTLTRILQNLRGIYVEKKDDKHLASVLSRLAVLAPSVELRKELAKVGGIDPPRAGSRDLN
jgi:regulator of sirC expression with transglutaminase-like and TPR domain